MADQWRIEWGTNAGEHRQRTIAWDADAPLIWINAKFRRLSDGVVFSSPCFLIPPLVGAGAFGGEPYNFATYN